MNMPENEFLLWNQNRWIPICKSELRRGDWFIARGLRNAKGHRIVMRLKSVPEMQADGILLWDIEFTNGTKAQQQSDLPPAESPTESHPPPCYRCMGSGIVNDNVFMGRQPCPLCQGDESNEG